MTSKGGANDAVGLVNSTTSPRSGPGPLITRRKEDLSRQKSHAATCFAVLFFFAHFVFSTAKSFGPNKGRRQSSCNQSHLSSSRERERESLIMGEKNLGEKIVSNLLTPSLDTKSSASFSFPRSPLNSLGQRIKFHLFLFGPCVLIWPRPN